MSTKGTVDSTPVEMTEDERQAIEAQIAALMEKVGAVEEQNPKFLDPAEQKRRAFEAVQGMGLTPAQVAVLNKWYLVVGWKFLGRAMIGKPLHECGS